ncbi:hypothetical protein FACUT_4332 [Fusarium acutatum]|uniref:Uncharacterized protein n=1 Tax=Fusarium acutatum TaxID=78861 RepID=A0A8H4JU99_9HYPO|nr:hypothetical protein FACUT_4332 [Fusarium acutatum]
MIESSSSFIKSSIPLYHNAVKSVIFKCAELLMGIFIFKLFSLLAARSRQFTSYLMFTEDYIQRKLYISSRGLSRAGPVVLAFSLLNIVFSLYGTLLWALDSPGYIFKATNATVADYDSQRNGDPPYIIQLALNGSQLEDITKRLPQVVGSELFKAGLNYTLTGKVMGKIGAATFDTKCVKFDGGSAVWYCTFDNAFAMEYVERVTGKPEVHWSDATDLDTRYILPERLDNIWVSVGKGGGSALMTQVFTVTKGKRRHTFSQATLKVTMITSPGDPFAIGEVTDLVRRTWSSNETEQQNPLIGNIVDGMMNAQKNDLSYLFGANTVGNNNKSALQSEWGFYTPQNNNNSQYSIVSITSTNMTLIRSETLDKAPEPFEKCERLKFQNEAFSGKVMKTDCTASKPAVEKQGFYGQVDTAAMMIV